MRMQDRIALVTGAASGIGKDLAVAFAREGAIVALADLKAEATQAAAAELQGMGGTALPIAMDVTDEQQVEAGVNQLVETYGRIDVLVSNAGIQYISSITELSLADWRKVLAVHLDGALLTTRACLRRMYAVGQGSIIYMGSVHSKEASPLKGPYVTAKHGLAGLCKVVAHEGAAQGVRANLLCPGFVRTPLVDKQIPEQAAELGISEDEVIQRVMLRETVDGEFTTTAELAEAAIFLATYPSCALTGQSLIVSHGWRME